jgi:hypothetical protein
MEFWIVDSVVECVVNWIPAFAGMTSGAGMTDGSGYWTEGKTLRWRFSLVLGDLTPIAVPGP